jgi:hypothetical protein
LMTVSRTERSKIEIHAIPCRGRSGGRHHDAHLTSSQQAGRPLTGQGLIRPQLMIQWRGRTYCGSAPFVRSHVRVWERGSRPLKGAGVPSM